MTYCIKAVDTSGYVTLHRESVPSAVKKASELMSDGCWDVEIEAPGGTVYKPADFESLREQANA